MRGSPGLRFPSLPERVAAVRAEAEVQVLLLDDADGVRDGVEAEAEVVEEAAEEGADERGDVDRGGVELPRRRGRREHVERATGRLGVESAAARAVVEPDEVRVGPEDAPVDIREVDRRRRGRARVAHREGHERARVRVGQADCSLRGARRARRECAEHPGDRDPRSGSGRALALHRCVLSSCPRGGGAGSLTAVDCAPAAASVHSEGARISSRSPPSCDRRARTARRPSRSCRSCRRGGGRMAVQRPSPMKRRHIEHG